MATTFYEDPIVVFERFRVKTHASWGAAHVDHRARSRLDEIAYNAQKMKSSEEAFLEAGGFTTISRPVLEFYDVAKKKKVLVSKYELEAKKTKNGMRYYRAYSGKLYRFVSKDFYNKYTTLRQRGQHPKFEKGDIVRHITTRVKYKIRWVDELVTTTGGTAYVYHCRERNKKTRLFSNSPQTKIPEIKLELVERGPGTGA